MEIMTGEEPACLAIGLGFDIRNGLGVPLNIIPDQFCDFLAPMPLSDCRKVYLKKKQSSLAKRTFV